MSTTSFSDLKENLDIYEVDNTYLNYLSHGDPLRGSGGPLSVAEGSRSAGVRLRGSRFNGKPQLFRGTPPRCGGGLRPSVRASHRSLIPCKAGGGSDDVPRGAGSLSIAERGVTPQNWREDPPSGSKRSILKKEDPRSGSLRDYFENNVDMFRETLSQKIGFNVKDPKGGVSLYYSLGEPKNVSGGVLTENSSVVSNYLGKGFLTPSKCLSISQIGTNRNKLLRSKKFSKKSQQIISYNGSLNRRLGCGFSTHLRKKSGGRNNQGKITVRHRDGKCAKNKNIKKNLSNFYLPSYLNKNSLFFYVTKIGYSPFHSAKIANIISFIPYKGTFNEIIPRDFKLNQTITLPHEAGQSSADSYTRSGLLRDGVRATSGSFSEGKNNQGGIQKDSLLEPRKYSVEQNKALLMKESLKGASRSSGVLLELTDSDRVGVTPQL